MAFPSRPSAVMNPSTALKSGLVMLALVAVLAVLLAVALPKSFFEDWGWFSRPGRTVSLRLRHGPDPRPAGWPHAARVFIAGIPGLIGVVTGVHWLGTLLAVLTFAVWCGYGPEPRRA